MKKIIAGFLFLLIASVTTGFAEAAMPLSGETVQHFQEVKSDTLHPDEQAFIDYVKKTPGIHQYRNLYVVALGPQPSAGYGIDLTRQAQTWEQYNVYFTKTVPQPGQMYAEVVTYPYIAGRWDGVPYSTLSLLDEKSQKPFLQEVKSPFVFMEGRNITDLKKGWTVTFNNGFNEKTAQNFIVTIENVSKNKIHPFALHVQLKSKSMKIIPKFPYEKNSLYLLKIKDTQRGTETIMPFKTIEALDKLTLSYDFSTGLQGWRGDFTDLPVKYDKNSFELEFGHKPIPLIDKKLAKALMLSGHNRSDDLFMFAKKKIGQEEGLLPNTNYEVQVELTLYTNADPGLSGIGGAPGESVFIKAGAATVEPKPIVRNTDHRLNIDKGEQAASGKNAVVIGNAAKEKESQAMFDKKTLKSSEMIIAKTDSKGELWLMFGSDSGFEGKSSLYYEKASFSLTKQ
ncbi:protease complex subunit PrcB family protein [Peribacillus saganii]|uniref:Protease complex subunit PrcB family protein n=1 Tax=Peribacillus saganii TaxID=2303992 RepID=A0A372LQZ6_9BACI|nr:protease complex subunit PrcB family protein [Peribacillus saganii]RFU70649.1 protease complex subunit PrcB family protein [Peribacillus saganii]